MNNLEKEAHPTYLLIISAAGYLLSANFFKQYMPWATAKSFPSTILLCDNCPDDAKNLFHSVIPLQTTLLLNFEYTSFYLCKKYKFKSIVGWNEREADLAAKLRHKFGVAGQSMEEVQTFRDKIKMKEKLLGTINIPQFTEASGPIEILELADKVGFPLIIKPVNGFAAYGVRKLENEAEVLHLRQLSSGKTYDVEEYISGPMYAIDGVFINKQVTLSWPTKYYNSPLTTVKSNAANGAFFVEENSNLFVKLQTFASKVLTAMSPENCVFHLECFLRGDDIIFCEIASRWPGGHLPQIWYRSFDINIIDYYFKLHFGLENISCPAIKANKIVGFLYCPPKDGILESISIPEMEGLVDLEVKVKIGEKYCKASMVMDYAVVAILEATSAELWEKAAYQFCHLYDTHFVYKEDM